MDFGDTIISISITDKRTLPPTMLALLWQQTDHHPRLLLTVLLCRWWRGVPPETSLAMEVPARRGKLPAPTSVFLCSSGLLPPPLPPPPVLDLSLRCLGLRY